MRHVVATAGHVDHGKSTLVRALTGMEPDRWAQERRRGLTIDLGYAWTRLSSGHEVAFVDVPGHRRFIGNMLSGLGPSAAVLLVVAADEGWRAQSEEHLRAVEALRLGQGLVVVTRSDVADPGPAMTAARERVAVGPLDWRGSPEARLAGGGPRGRADEVPAVAVSAVSGEGMAELRAALMAVCAGLPRPDPHVRVRLWVDRAFTVRGSGTVVTGTLEAGTLRTGDQLMLASRASVGGTATTAVTVRGLQTTGRPVGQLSGAARVAVNLRGVTVDDVSRGDALLTPGAWPLAGQVDVHLDGDADELPQHLTLHVGAADLPVRLRPLKGPAGRLTLDRALPLRAGDRAILRTPGVEGAVTGLAVMDVDPPDLDRRGSGARRGSQLVTEAQEHGVDRGRDPLAELVTEVERRGHLDVATARLLGLVVELVTDDRSVEHSGGADSTDPSPVLRLGDHLVSRHTVGDWQEALLAAVDAQAEEDSLDPLLPVAAARDRSGLPDRDAVEAVARLAGLVVERGTVARQGTKPSLGAAQASLDTVLARLAQDPFAAPEAGELTGLGLGPRQVAAAAATGQVLRLGEGILLLPRSPALAMVRLAQLPQPFTTSQARQALDTTRRVAIPLLEHLDDRGWTRRIDAGHREVVH